MADTTSVGTNNAFNTAQNLGNMMTSNGTGIRILGTLRSADGRGVVRMQDRFDTDIDDLWSALTEPRRLARWIAEVEGDDLRPGGEVAPASPVSGKAPCACRHASPRGGCCC